VLGVYGESTATRPSRPFGTPKSARASQELPILAQSLDTRMDPVS
jgi:hypothetical protein